MFESAEPLRAEFAELEATLADPATHGDLAKARRIGRRYAELTPIVSTLDEYDRLSDDLAAARELAPEDESFAAEATELEQRLVPVVERLTRLLAPRDPNDSADAILEIKSGEGGEESALFAGDLLKMYSRYAETRGWKTEIIDAQETDLGGYKSVTVAIKASSVAEPDQMPYGVLKFEGGVHRVQRVPVTESQGRVHTSAAGVLVMPEVEESEVEIDEGDLRIDVYRSSGPGGQGVNTTDSAVRITHLPTGIVVSCQNERSQLQNREQAMRMLRARLIAAAEESAAAEASAARRSQVRTVDRSERIRTYNYGENRIADHRIGFKAYNLDQVLNGDLSAVLTALQEADTAERLAAAGVESAAVDARLLLAHVCGCEPRDVERQSLSPTELSAYEELIGRRAARAPLQHLTGRAYFRYLEVLVGPGVFVPRPETEVMVGWAVEQLRSLTAAGRHPLAVDLGTGSGVIAKSLATEAPGSRVVAVEVSPDAISWARRNLADTGVELVEADLAVALPELDGTVDLVVANPPYIPLEAFASVAPEARDHDPTVALFSGLDGLDAIRHLVVAAARLLRPGGRLAFEHAEVQAESAAEVVLRHGGFSEVRDHRDLTGRSRFVTATSLVEGPNGPGGGRSSGRMVG